MSPVDTKRRRSTISHYLSSIQDNVHKPRKRAQSLCPQPTRISSILQSNTHSMYDPRTLDRKSLLKLSISAPLPEILSSPSRSRDGGGGDAPSSSFPSLRTSFIDARPREESPNSTRTPRRLQFVEPAPSRTPSKSARRGDTHCNRAPTRTRTVARLSRSTGQLYYIEEPIPTFLTPTTTCFSPPPPSFWSSQRSSRLASHRTGFCQCSHPLCINNRRGCLTGEREATRSGPSELYTSPPEKMYAHWAAFALGMRFRMLKAQDRVKGGVAWMEGVVERVRTGRGR